MRFSLRYTLLALPLLSGVIAEEPSTQTSEASSSIYTNAQEAFQDLLNALPEESLQAALNSLTKFKAGVFESHRRGVEHVHNSSPALATKLIVAAVQDLKKRQVVAPSNNATSIAPSQTSEQPQSSAPQSVSQSIQNQPSQPPESSQQQSSTQTPATNTEAPSTPISTPPSTPTSRPALVPVEVTTVNQEGRTLIQTNEVFSEVTASVQVTVTRTITNQQGSTVAVTTQEVRPAVIRTTTDSRGAQVTVTSAAIYAPTRGEVITTTNAAGSTFLTTFTPGGGRVSSVKVITTTDAEGRRQTTTFLTYVDPTQEGGSSGGGGGGGGGTEAPTGTGDQPRVQSGSANKNNQAVMGALAGLGAFAFFF